MISATKESTILPNAVPITTATARSTTLPRMRKSLKPLIMSRSVLRSGPITHPGREHRAASADQGAAARHHMAHPCLGCTRRCVSTLPKGPCEGTAFAGRVALTQASQANPRQRGATPTRHPPSTRGVDPKPRAPVPTRAGQPPALRGYPYTARRKPAGRTAEPCRDRRNPRTGRARECQRAAWAAQRT